MRLKDFLKTMTELPGWRIAPLRCIRRGDDCPITAVHFAKLETRCSTDHPQHAAHRLGIPYPAAIVNAADGDPRFPGDHDYSNVEHLRTLLLKAAKL